MGPPFEPGADCERPAVSTVVRLRRSTPQLHSSETYTSLHMNVVPLRHQRPLPERIALK